MKGGDKSNMLQINESISGYDIAELLVGEAGIFEAISPEGGKYQLISRAGHSIANFRPISDNARTKTKSLWRVRKVGELRSEQETV